VGILRGGMWKVVILTILSLGAFAYSVYEFLRVQSLERMGDPISFGSGRHALIDRIFYDLGGKWGVAGSDAVVGVVFAAWAVHILRRS
jgi:hypothetical protein